MVENIQNYLKYIADGFPEYEEGVRETIAFLERQKKIGKLPRHGLSFEMYELVKDPPYHHSLFLFEPSSLQLVVEGEKKRLSFTEARVLKRLSDHENTVLPHENFESIIDPNITAKDPRNMLAVYMNRLRRKIDNGRGIQSPIESIKQRGYRLNNPNVSRVVYSP